MRRVLAFLALLGLLCSCAAPPPAPLHESADHKYLLDFLGRYQRAWNERDEKAVLRLYAEDARTPAMYAPGDRVLSKGELAANLEFILKDQARAGMALAWLAKPVIVVSGDRAEADVVARIAYVEYGEPGLAYQGWHFTLSRRTGFWKIERARFEYLPKTKALEARPALEGEAQTSSPASLVPAD